MSIALGGKGDEGVATLIEALRADANFAFRCNVVRFVRALTTRPRPRRELLYLSEALAASPTLALASNQIGDKGAAHLADLIASTSSLAELNTAFNAYTNVGVRCLVEAAARRPATAPLKLVLHFEFAGCLPIAVVYKPPVEKDQDDFSASLQPASLAPKCSTTAFSSFVALW
ncbi:hypothetical protein CTAYLR_007971 [Chrysophaeum taylorii]|uniref:Uncharacterized protein n=1 Tax=Chrysophaeum taylorii TaxID=2483200 RepID=A0AAD7UC94_9STRA|nr:hypothetical protein CTAYLR_007971 [Chrysophaeum taylorii]